MSIGSIRVRTSLASIPAFPVRLTPNCRRGSIVGSLHSSIQLLSLSHETSPASLLDKRRALSPALSIDMITLLCSTRAIRTAIAMPGECIEQLHPAPFSMRSSRRSRVFLFTLLLTSNGPLQTQGPVLNLGLECQCWHRRFRGPTWSQMSYRGRTNPADSAAVQSEESSARRRRVRVIGGSMTTHHPQLRGNRKNVGALLVLKLFTSQKGALRLEHRVEKAQRGGVCVV